MASISLNSAAMPESDWTIDADFDAQMRGLFQEAQHVMEGRQVTCSASGGQTQAASATNNHEDESNEDQSQARSEPVAPRPVPMSLPQMLRPLVLGLEAVSRATGENATVLQKLDQAADAAAQAHKDLPELLNGLRSMLEQKNAVNQRMFDALYDELKGYKDGFLLESVHRPILRDLITLYDDLAEIHRQVASAINAQLDTEFPAPMEALLQRLRSTEMNIEHNLEFIVEVLARLEVVPLPTGSGRLDKKTQRAVAVELAEDPEEDAMVVRTAKRGFLWKDRVFRAEEVVIKKWKEGFLVAIPPNSQV